MSDPADLIREADAALAQEAANEGGPIVDDPATLVRRLRDALEASTRAAKFSHGLLAIEREETETLTAALAEARAERDQFENARAAAVVKCADVTIERDEARAALAEANTTIAEREAERDEARKGVEQTMQLLFDTRARLDGLKAELAESNAAIERAKAMGAITGPLYTHALNQALKGERP